MSKITTGMKVGSIAQFGLYLVGFFIVFLIYDTYKKAQNQ